MANELVERLRERCNDWDGRVMPDCEEPRNSVTCGDLREVIKALEAADAMFDILNGQEGRRIASGRPRAGDDQKIAHAIDAYYAATQKGNGDD